jgi:hypothetical protein
LKTNAAVTLLAVCELAQVTQDGKLSLLGIFSRLTARAVPLRIPRFFMVGMLKGTPLAEHQVSFQILGPKSLDSIQEYQATVRLGFDGKANVLNELTNATLMEYGKYTVIINVDGKRVESTDLLVDEPEGPNLARSSSSVAN